LEIALFGLIKIAFSGLMKIALSDGSN
jgi:hypothetical protein